MKTTFVSLFLILFTLSSFKPVQNATNNKLYEVTIFKWCKDEKGEEQKTSIVIDQNGNVKVNRKDYNTLVDMKRFTKGINKFITGEKLIKQKANNEPPKMDITPKKGEQFISIIIIELDDFRKEKDFANNSQYLFRKIKKSSDDIELYKYLQSNDSRMLKKILL